jgi:hypothetical protein
LAALIYLVVTCDVTSDGSETNATSKNRLIVDKGKDIRALPASQWQQLSEMPATTGRSTVRIVEG